jgi:hypothetical protein
MNSSHIETVPELSAEKRRALRQITYDSFNFEIGSKDTEWNGANDGIGRFLGITAGLTIPLDGARGLGVLFDANYPRIRGAKWP